MRIMLGSVEVMTNNRITLPKKLVSELDTKDGDFLLFYEEDSGEITVVKQPGRRVPDRPPHGSPKSSDSTPESSD